MEKGEIREKFLIGCSLAAKPLQQSGFRCLQKGQCWKKTSNNKDMIYEVYFGSSHYNSESHIACRVQVSIYSKKAKAMDFEQTQNPYEEGLIFYADLRDNPVCYTEWNFADESRELAVNEIAVLINQYVLPVFELFENPNEAVEWLKKSPIVFNDWMHCTEPFALSFMLIYGGLEAAEDYMNQFLSLSPKRFQNRVRQWYPTLKDATTLDFNYNEFAYASKWKKAYMYGVQLHDDWSN